MRGSLGWERVVSGLAWVVIALASGAPSAAEPQSKLVSTQWLSENLSRQDVLILDVRRAEGAYGEGHIRGAVRFSIEELRGKEPPARPLSASELPKALGKAGIAAGTTVIAYADEESAGTETYVLYALDSLGHGGAAALDGGFGKWRADGREVAAERKEAAPREYGVPKKAIEGFGVEPAEIEAWMRKGEIAVIEVEAEGGTVGEGRLAGAIRRGLAEDLRPDGSWKDAKELEQEYRALGVDGGKPIVVWGRDGIAASRVWFTLRHVLGFENVRLYEGELSRGAGDVKEPSRGEAEVRKLIESRCARCHSPSVPLGKKGKKSAAWWTSTIGRMIAKGARLGADESAAIIDYLATPK